MKNEIVEYINTLPSQTEETPTEPMFISEYDPKYCHLLLDYAQEHQDIEGFYARYMILPATSELWAKTYSEWADTLALAPHMIKDSINRAIKVLQDISTGNTSKLDLRNFNLDLMQKLVLRSQEIHFKTEKETGDYKRKGITNANKSKYSNAHSQRNEKVGNMVKVLIEDDDE